MSVFVGREKELSTLNGALDASLGGRGRAVFLSAEAGAGKSTLVDHFLGRIGEDHPGLRVLRAGCSEQYGGGEPYQPFVEAFRALVAGDAAAGRPRGLREIAKKIAPYWIAAIPVAGEFLAASVQTAKELRHSMGGAGSGPGSSAPSEEALFFQYTQLFFAAAEADPIVLFIDDLHWADTASVSLLTHMARRVADQRILILGSYRPVDVDVARHPMRDARRELERYGVAEEVVLEPLGTAALAELVAARAGAAPDAELLAWLEQRAGTNALFFEGLLEWLGTEGFLEIRGGSTILSRRPSDVQIPRSAAATIEKRLERLDEDERRTLEYASVEGGEFASTTVARLLDVDELDLEERLEPLARVHRLIRLVDTRDMPDGDLASVYAFSHSLVHEVLHDSIQGKRRILLHRKMAQILEDVFASDLTGVSARLAVHFEEGRAKDRAFEFAVMAAERAASLYAHWDAMEQLERAIRSAERDADIGRAWELLGQERYAVGRYAEAESAFSTALTHVKAAADAVASLRVKRRQLLAERDRGARPAPEIVASLHELRMEAAELEVNDELCEILWQLIVHPATTAALDLSLAEEALALAEEVGDPAFVAKGRGVLGVALTMVGQTDKAIEHTRKAREIYQELEDREKEASCLNSLGITFTLLGDLTAADAHLREAIDIFDDIVDPSMGAAARQNLAVGLIRQGRFERAETLLREAIDLAERMDAPARRYGPLQNLAECFEMQRDWARAEGYWRELLEGAAAGGFAPEEIIAWCGVGTCRLAAGDVDGAMDAEANARRLLGDDKNWGEHREAFLLLSARLAAAAGETAGAVDIVRVGEEELEGLDMYGWARFRLERASMLSASDPAQAAELAREARAASEGLGALALRNAADELLATLEA
ncbi:MAG TPA: AAA family ATPase [Longimicrobiales bacterium]|nr:AAA family ATPase [Longimicrobiales bacterium]